MAAEGTMKAVYIEEAERCAVSEVPVPEPGPRDALIRMGAVGVCGSDIHYYDQGRVGPFVITEPLIVGHECAGEVVEVGSEVQDLKPGDRVAIEPGIPCRYCEHCKTGNYNLCRSVDFMGTPPHHGAFREYVAWPADFLFRLPDSVSTEAGATIEPLAVGLQAVKLVNIRPGETVTVMGAGPIGLLAIAGARAAGAGEVAVVDLIPMRLQFAGKMGASRALNAAEVDVAQELRDSSDVVLDCVGAEETVLAGIEIARAGGRIAWVGMAADNVRIPLVRSQSKELRFVGTWRYANVYPAAVQLLASGKVDTGPLITHRFSFPEVEQALKFASQNRRQALKTMVNFA